MEVWNPRVGLPENVFRSFAGLKMLDFVRTTVFNFSISVAKLWLLLKQNVVDSQII